MRIFKTLMFLLLIFSTISCKREDSVRLTRENCYNQELGETVVCGTFEVMENRDVGRSRKFKLNFIIIPARTSTPAPDPVFVFTGGPGCGAAQEAASWAQDLDRLRQEREIVLVDQRGTGSSNPLPCNRIGDQQSAQTYLQDMFPEDYVRRCREELERNHDLHYYHSTITAADIDDLRQALGYDRINLYGGSYGSYMAIVYMKNFPGTVRSACLNRPAVPSELYPATLAEDTQEVLERMFSDCAADPNCAADYPNLGNEFYEILFRLQHGPVTVNITNPINNRPETVTFTYNNFIHGFRSLLYRAAGQGCAPAIIYWAYRGIYSPIVERTVQALYWDQINMMYGMFLCVTCTESIPYIDYTAARARAAGTFMGTYRLDQQQQACALWVRGDLPAGFLNPPTVGTPTLILTGDIDPTIRPYVGERLTGNLPNSLHYNVPNAGHEMGNTWENCLEDVVAQFISQGSAASLDFRCADTNQRPPWISWRDLPTENHENLEKIRAEIKALFPGTRHR
jgi:pimeloyl-ACP methyl ester carboxylesterase